LTLSQVAARTGRHPELLRQWCAAGRIPCQRLGGSWLLREADLPLLDRMATRARRRTRAHAPRTGRRRLLAAVFEEAARAEEAMDGLRTRLKVDDGAIEAGPIGVGRLGALGLTVVAGQVAEELVLDARRILGSFGGKIVADLEAEPSASSSRPVRSAAGLGQASTEPNTSAALSPPNPNEVDSTRR
jgi:hypothetical protein